ncbi:hypothetical protein B0H14DRAFT_2452256 [Mycena olivaceomarginata]|nr:hypothetical protein B0H14DRAFT_2452256 [Mycena olivaceomarginata]
MDQTHLVLTDGTKRVLVPRPKTYDLAIDAARRHFPSIKVQDIILQTDQLPICGEELTDIAPESWETLVDSLSSVVVAERQEPSEKDNRVPVHAPTTTKEIVAADPNKINIRLWFEGDTLSIAMRPTTPFIKVKALLAEKYGRCHRSYTLDFDGFRLSGDDTPASRGIENNDSILVYLEQVGGKPVIYVYSPVEIDATVALTLSREWSFSAIYPVVPVKPTALSAGQRVEWNFRTHLDGSLTESNTGLDVAYLFWEAHTNQGIPESPTVSQVIPVELFSPLNSDLTPTDSVLVAVSEITPYLDKVLLALGLHTEARTSFITYWLPSILKYQHVALRFIPQAAYEAAAILDFKPVPDVVTRVFMLFKGIADDALGDWREAKSTENDVERWRKVVGVDVDRALDTAPFRVLEWGGMEVLTR